MTLGSKRKCNLNVIIFFNEINLRCVFKMLAVLSVPQCVNYGQQLVEDSVYLLIFCLVIRYFRQFQITNQINPLWPQQIGCHFVDDISNVGKICISVEVSLKFVLDGPNNNVSKYVQLMVWRRTDNKLLSETILAKITDTIWRYQLLKLLIYVQYQHHPISALMSV